MRGQLEIRRARLSGYTGRGTYVVPDREHEHHGGGDGLAHLGETSPLGEDVGIAEGLLLRSAVVGGDRVARVAGDVRLRVLKDLAILHVEPLDLSQVSVAALEELGDHSELLGGVEGEARAGALHCSGSATNTTVLRDSEGIDLRRRWCSADGTS